MAHCFLPFGCGLPVPDDVKAEQHQVCNGPRSDDRSRGHSFVALGPDTSDVHLLALPLCFPAQSLAQRQSTPESARLSHNYAQLPGV
jgi:hypothetical protein